MRKQMKIAAVVSAAALLAIGASFTSMAAEKGTWKLEDGEWYCYDKDGDAIEEEFCLSNGKEFYVGEGGALVTSSWVENDGSWYYVNSAGEKVVNDWRYTAPAEDEDADEEWFYLQSTGKRAEDKKMVINGKTYFFDSEGVMLTGWVQESDSSYDEASVDDVKNTKIYYCGEDGARLSKEWVKTYAPSVDVDEDDLDDEDEHWYYIKSNGRPATGKQSNINGQTYFFSVEGTMLTGWVAYTNSQYVEVWEEDAEGTALGKVGGDVYFCGSEDDGHAKKNKWIKEYPSTKYGYDDSDNDKYWFYIQSNGKVFVPTEDLEEVQEYDLMDVTAAVGSRFDADDAWTAVEKKINSKYYLFNADGRMLSGFIADKNDNMFYYGGSNEGDRKEGSFTVTDDGGETARCYFSTEDKASEGYFDGVGVNGAKNGKLYADGVLVKANDDKYEMVTVDEMTFIVNKSGSIQSDKNVYKEDGEELFGGKKFTYSSDKGVAYHSVTGEQE